MNAILRGLLGGLAGTALYTGELALARATGVMKGTPPRKITERIQRRADVRDDLSLPTFTASWIGAHFAFGAVWGVLYALGKRLIPGPTPLRGILFGTLVWGLHYLGVLPWTGLFNPTSRDARDSPFGALLLGHFIYGITLAAVDDRLSAASPREATPE